MKIIGTKAEIIALPHWAKSFLDHAWDAPDAEHQRKANPRFTEMKKIGAEFAGQIDAAIQSPEIVSRNYGFSITDQGGAFGQADFWENKQFEIAFTLALIWNTRRTIASCVVCENLMAPSKGRAAQYCSNNCRIKHHRGTA